MTGRPRQSACHPFTVHNEILGSGMLHQLLHPSYPAPLRLETIRSRGPSRLQSLHTKAIGRPKGTFGYIKWGTFRRAEDQYSSQPIGIRWHLSQRVLMHNIPIRRLARRVRHAIDKSWRFPSASVLTPALRYIMNTHVHRVHGIGSSVSHRFLLFPLLGTLSITRPL